MTRYISLIFLVCSEIIYPSPRRD